MSVISHIQKDIRGSVVSGLFMLLIVLMIAYMILDVVSDYRSDPIFKAIETNDKEKVIEAIKNPQKLDEIKWISPRRLKAALPHAEDDISYKAFMRPLHYAVFLNRYEMVELLLENQTDPNIQIKSSGRGGSYGNALNLSVLADHPKITRLLLNSDVDAHIMVGWGTPLHIAARYGFEKQIELLVKSGVHVNIQRPSRTEVLDVSYVDERDTSIEGCTALHWAVRYKHVEVIEDLIQAGADLDIVAEFGTPLCIAARYGLLGPAELLISAGANVKLSSPLESASFYRSVYKNVRARAHYWDAYRKIIRLLVESGASINKKDINFGYTPFHRVVKYGNDVETVEYLIEKGANINQTTDRGLTALHIAVEETFNLNLVETLLKANANPNLQTDIGVAPLHLAAFNGEKEVVKLLLEYGADKTLRLSKDAAINTYRNNDYRSSSSKPIGGHTAEMLTSSSEIKDLLK